MNPLFQVLSQTWPARAVKSLYEAAKHPGEVYAGRADPMDVEKATDLAGLAMTGGLGGLGGMSRQGVVGSGPIKAYHGSPHDFDRFDLSKIGTGEGAQAYGHGLYFADNEAVARSYRDALTGNRVAAAQRALGGGTVDEALGKVASEIEALHALPNKGGDPERWARQLSIKQAKIDELTALKNSGDMSKGRMYEVAIHADPERFLDWDKPLVGQSPAVRKAMEDAGYSSPATVLPPQYSTVGYMAGRGLRDPKETADLAQRGIAGVKYLDAGSRTAGAEKGSRNYVTFSDNIVEILRKYGLVGGLGGLGGMQAMQEPRT